MRALIKADGTRRELTPPVSIQSIRVLIGADTLDTVNLRHLGYPMHVMLVDDLGHKKGLPVNVEATKLYHANCYPGTKHQIRGDAVVVLDDDFAAAPAQRVPLDPNCAWPFPGHARAVDGEEGKAA
jgi:hypothetical protein